MANQKNTASPRRSFIKTSVLAGGGLMLNFTWLSSLAETSADGPIPTSWVELGGFIRITPENIIKILNPNPDFGQNVMTSLPMIVAEE